ncbi:MAG: T9SS type A sorting domain-containing protein [Draconibacterium sp.]
MDLTGIEALISLEHLECSNNQIKTLDLSSNQKLKYFYCNQNQLQLLDLSQNKELKFLIATNNQLLNLNLQNGNNKNMAVDVMNNPDLTCIQVDDPETAYTMNWGKSQCAGFSDDCSTFKLQMVYFPDDKFEQTLIARGIDCGVLNDSVPAFAIDKIESLDIRGLEITDLTGIEYFKSLKSLDCSSNYLTSLNLSENTALEHLYCAYNGFTDLQLPSGNLKHLDCTYNNLDSLDILQLGKIEKLYCGNNKLKTLDLIGNTNLTTLFCETNEIENLDLSNNTNLEMLIARENQLVSLDVSKNPKLYYLECGKNNLNQLNLRNGNIKNFAIVDASNNPDLFCIEVDDPEIAYTKNVWYKNNYAVYTENCSEYKSEMTYVPDNVFEGRLMYLGYDTGTPNDSVATAVLQHITSLNFNSSGVKDLTGIEACTGLTEFFCDENKLTSLDFSSNKKLKTLSCTNNSLTSLNIGSNVNLEYLRCDYNNLNELDISSNLLLYVFSCSSNNISSLDLKAHKDLVEINCQYNKIKYLDLSKTDSLLHVACTDNQLEVLNLKNGHNDRLNSLYCENNQLTCIQVDDPKSIPYYFDWRKDEKASYSSDCGIPPVKIVDLGNSFIDVFPNPAHDKVFVETGNKPVSVEIYNPIGSIVFKDDNFVSSWIEIEKYNPGMYIFRITEKSADNIINKKVVVEKQK